MELNQEYESDSSIEEQNFSSDENQSSSEPTEILDLNNIEKFKFDDHEWTPKDLKGAILMQSDYSRKTQALAEERKFYDNLHYDLDRVAQQPDLVDQFKKIYPEKFHGMLRYILKETKQPDQSLSQKPEDSKPNENDQWRSRFENLEQRFLDQEVKTIEAQLDAKFETLKKKYPYADEESIVSRALYLHENGTNLDDQVWDALFKQVNDRVKGMVTGQTNEAIEKQKELNKQGRDVAPGGGIPGRAPKRPKTIEEASKLALEQLNSM